MRLETPGETMHGLLVDIEEKRLQVESLHGQYKRSVTGSDFGRMFILSTNTRRAAMILEEAMDTYDLAKGEPMKGSIHGQSR